MYLGKFSGLVKSVTYHKIEPKNLEKEAAYYNKLEVVAFESDLGESIDATNYYASLKMQERTRGRFAKKHIFNISIYISEEQYKNKEIEKGDLLVFDKSKIYTNNFVLKLFDQEKIKENPAEKLRVDAETQKPYILMNLTASRLTCKQGDWSIKIKHDKLHFWNVNRFHFNYETKEQLVAVTRFGYYLNKDEYEKLLPVNGQIVEARAYSMGTPCGAMKVSVKVGYRQDVDKYFCNITKVEG